MISPARHKTADQLLGTTPQEETFFGALPPIEAGMMVLSSSMRILHMNAQARAVMARFGIACDFCSQLSPESMPAILTEFCGHVLSELRQKADSQEWTALEMRRVCHMVTPALLIRGFGVPETEGRDPRMILILQPYHS